MKAVRTVVFAKAPLPGQAKTRLIPALGAKGAAWLAQQMLEATVARALEADIGPVELCTSPAYRSPAWPPLSLPEDKLAFSSQGRGDLGRRMARAAQRTIAAGQSLLIIGCDIPQLDVAHLRLAANLLQQHDCTLFPAADGGYVLIGLNRFDPLLFTQIPWSTGNVAMQTLQRLNTLGWSVGCGPCLHDVDTVDDLEWLPAAWRRQTD